MAVSGNQSRHLYCVDSRTGQSTRAWYLAPHPPLFSGSTEGKPQTQLDLNLAHPRHVLLQKCSQSKIRLLLTAIPFETIPNIE